MCTEHLMTSEKKFSRLDSLMSKISRSLGKTKKAILDEFELTCSQFEILSAIYQISLNNNEVIQIELAEKTQIDPMTTSTILRNLEKRELITRQRGLVNTRTVEVELTELGLKMYYEAQIKINQMQKEVYQNMDDQDFMNQLLLLSNKLNNVNFSNL